MIKPGCLCFKQQFYQACSFRTCFLLLLIFLFVLFITVGVPTLIFLLILKPLKPTFTPQSVTLDSYKLKVHANSSLFVSALASLVLNTSNPNKFSLNYSPSKLRIYSQGIPVAQIRVPDFSQPAHSRNLSLSTVVVINSVNVSQVIGGSMSQAKSEQNNVQMKLLGDVRLKLRMLHITLPKIKVSEIFLQSFRVTSSNHLS